MVRVGLAWVLAVGMAVTALATEPSVTEMLERAKAGPSLLFTPAMLPEIRSRAARDPAAAKILQDLTKKAEGPIRQAAREGTLTVPDRGGQWPLWMTCKKCGSTLKSKAPTQHVCTKCAAEYTGWPYDDCYISAWHSKLAGQVRNCGILWGIMGTRKYADHAKAILLAYADAYEKYEWHDNNGPTSGPKRRGSRAFSQILDEAVWLIPLMDGYDAIRAQLTAEERAKIETKLIRASTETIMTENAKWSNHEVWHLAAYGMAGVVLRDAKLLDKSLHGPYGALRQLEHGILSDGLWYEGSLHYHFYTMNAFLPYFRTLAHLGYAVPARFKEMFLSPIGQLTPDGMRPPINDSWPGRFVPGDLAKSYELAAAWWPDDDLFRWWVAQKPRTTVEYLLWGKDAGAPADGGAALSPVLHSRIYDASGLAVLRSRTDGCGGVMPDNCVMLDFGPHGEWHGHPDKLNLMLWLRGRCVAEDPGCIGYGNPRHWGWYKSTLAHNALRVDNRNQGPSTGELLAFYTNANVAAVAVFASGKRAKATWDGPAYAGVDMWRVTALCGDVVLDFLAAASDQAHDYEWCFHSRGEVDFPGAQAVTNLPPRFVMKKYGHVALTGEDAWSWVDAVKEKPIGRTWNATWQAKDRTLNLWQEANGEGTLRTGKGSAQPASEKLTLLTNRLHGNQAVFASVLVADRCPAVKFGAVHFAPDGKKGFEVWVDGRQYSLVLSDNKDLSVTTK